MSDTLTPEQLVEQVREALAKMTPGQVIAVHVTELDNPDDPGLYYLGIEGVYRGKGSCPDATADLLDSDENDRHHANAQGFALLRNAAHALLAAAEERDRLYALRCPKCGLTPMELIDGTDLRTCSNCINQASAEAEADGLEEWMAVAKEYEAERDRLAAENATLRSNSAHQANVFETAASGAFAERDELRDQVAKLRESLAPFAHDIFVASMPSDQIAFGGPMVRVGDYRRAAEVLAATAPKEPAK